MEPTLPLADTLARMLLENPELLGSVAAFMPSTPEQSTPEQSTPLLSDTLTRKELAAELHCSERTIIRMEKIPDGLPSLLIAGKVYYRRTSVLQWLERRERRPNPTRRTRRAA